MRPERQGGNWTAFMNMGAGLAFVAALLHGCVPPPDGGDSDLGIPANSTDRTNGGALFVQSASCRACHSDIAAAHDLHGHAYALTAIQSQPPGFPALSPGVPDPPSGFTWADVSYVVGGYLKRGRFTGIDGFLLTNGTSGVDTQWNHDFPANGTTAGFVAYEATAVEPLAFDITCFVCHTTGPLGQSASAPLFQENRPGIPGTWQEAGVQCEACHGPGSNHFTSSGSDVEIRREGIFVDSGGIVTCNLCHSRPYADGTGEIRAESGFILPYQQYAEVRASGGHADFSCTVCHDPHRSTIYDRASAIRNECTVCHTDTSMAGHGGNVFMRGNYSEVLSCASCHMPFATSGGTFAAEDVVGSNGRMGDTRTHIFRINDASADFTDVFSEDGQTVIRDSFGRAALTVDFVCLRCHNGIGEFEIPPDRAAEIARRIHELP